MLSQLPKLTSPRPFLKWAGGKSKLIQQYKQYLPNIHDYKTYHEPFLGGGALFFYLLPAKAVLTDINSELITTYVCVRDKLQELLNILKLHQFYHSRDYYYKVRENPGRTDVEKAARLIYLNRTCFNGLYRVNSKGEFNVPLGKYDNPKICQLEMLVAASEVLQSSVIEELDFSHVLNKATNCDDFVFFDPPYYPISGTSYFTAYSKVSFNELDQIRLRDTCFELNQRGVKVMVCNSDCEFIRNIYTEINFQIHTVKATRVINSNIKNRGSIGELLITSY
jgi:DNA adenine methylase